MFALSLHSTKKLQFLGDFDPGVQGLNTSLSLGILDFGRYIQIPGSTTAPRLNPAQPLYARSRITLYNIVRLTQYENNSDYNDNSGVQLSCATDVF